MTTQDQARRWAEEVELPEPDLINWYGQSSEVNEETWWCEESIREAIAAALVKFTQEQEPVAWLIERNLHELIGPEWFVGGPTNSVDFSKDPDKVMRFSRRQDAQSMLDWLRRNNKLHCVESNVEHYYKVTEHLWVGPAPSQQEERKPQVSFSDIVDICNTGEYSLQLMFKSREAANTFKTVARNIKEQS